MATMATPHSVRSLVLCLAAPVALLTACADSPTEARPLADEAAQRRSGSMPTLQYSSPIPTLNSDRPSEVPALYLAERIPGFGGLYFENRRLVVVLTSGGDESIARKVLAAFVSDASEMVEPRVEAGSDIVIRNAEHSFLELREWRDNISFWAFGLPAVVSTALSQRKNRIVIGIEDLSAGATVEARLSQEDIPLEAVQIVKERRWRPNAGPLLSPPPPENGPTLRDYRRPIEGGLILARLGNTPGTGCTFGFNAIQSSWAHAVTASHCSSQFAAMDGTYFFEEQAIEDSTHFVGLEYHDPLPSGCGWWWCTKWRLSDATLLAVPAYVQVHQGYIARTMGSGSIMVDPANPTFRITRHALVVAEEDPVHMMGQYSGWQQGTVTDIKDIVGPRGVVLKDQAEADYKAGEGNSGAPVFIRLGGDSVTLAGVHNGDNDEPVYSSYYRAYFSPLANVMQDLGEFDARAPAPPPPPPPVDVSILGPTQIKPEAICTWEAVVDPPGGTYSYAWYNDGILAGTGQYYTGGKDPANQTDHFTVRVDVSGDGLGSQTITVYESPSAPFCFQ